MVRVQQTTKKLSPSEVLKEAKDYVRQNLRPLAQELYNFQTTGLRRSDEKYLRPLENILKKIDSQRAIDMATTLITEKVFEDYLR